MTGISRAHEEHIRELLQGASVARDMLPYTPEFDQLKRDYYGRTFTKLTDAEFWRVIITVAKKGGVTGKSRAKAAPSLTEEQKQTLIGSIPCSLGERDRLPYSESFHKAIDRFNNISSMSLSYREAWLAILSAAK